MKFDCVCEPIYSTRGDEELSINGTLEPGGTIVLKKHTWQEIGPISTSGRRILRHVIAWYHSSGDVLTDEKKQGVAAIGRDARVRGTYLKGMMILSRKLMKGKLTESSKIYVLLFLQPDILKFLMAYTGNNKMKLICYKQFKFIKTSLFGIVIWRWQSRRIIAVLKCRGKCYREWYLREARVLWRRVRPQGITVVDEFRWLTSAQRWLDI